MQHPDHRHAKLAQLFGQRIDRLDDLARSRHLRRRSRRAEQFLHVDDDQSRAPWIELVEPVIASAPCDHAINDLLAYGHLVHRVLDQNESPSENIHKTLVSSATAFSQECGMSERKCRYSSAARS